MNRKNLGFIFCVAVLFFSSAYSMKRKRDDSGKRAQRYYVENFQGISKNYEKKQPYYCHYLCCEYSNWNKAAINLHHQLHTEKNVLQCYECDFLTKNNDLLINHVMVLHQNQLRWGVN